MMFGRLVGRIKLPEPRLWKQLLPPLALFAAIFILQTLAGFAPRFVERYYSLGLFPFITRVFRFANFLNFSLAEMLLAILLAALAVWIAWTGWQIYKRRNEAVVLLLAAMRSLLWIAAIAFTVFMLAFGFNYKREFLADTLQLEKREPGAIEIETISRIVIEGVNHNYEASRASVEAAGENQPPLDSAQLQSILEAAYENEPILRGADKAQVRPKPLYFSGLISRLGISGVYSPFTGEPNYNAIQPDFDLPFSIAHEMAHQRGFAREDEANFVAFLVCTRASHPYVRYSGYLGALRVLGLLYRIAPERYRETVAGLGEGPRADLRTRGRFWARYGGRLSNFGSSINNVYLKMNGVRSGVRNYNEAALLIVGFYLKQAAPKPAGD